eukprot:Blabericola_migrator_1__4402@NODE_2363_length_2874_cov_30_972212_g1481_i0_p1_GENE_NODE_2363_length_2874_cov_30_972212_g1481_i0NODE_2363_length_2874_cov_30_972212_g1481_i0_p1_ORF_typecomplete_len498_score56_14DUF3710/PF12502_8/0_74_NODE_2363_length_2874_cov_30_972212_g1481_i013812844
MRCVLTDPWKTESPALKSAALCLVASPVFPVEVSQQSPANTLNASSAPRQSGLSNIIREAFQRAIETEEDGADEWSSTMNQGVIIQQDQALEMIAPTAGGNKILPQVPNVQIKRKAEYSLDGQVYEAQKTKRQLGEQAQELGVAKSRTQCSDVQQYHPAAPLGVNAAEYVCPLVSSSQEASTSQGVMGTQMPPRVEDNLEDTYFASSTMTFGAAATISQDSVGSPSEHLLDLQQDSAEPSMSTEQPSLFRKYRTFNYICKDVPSSLMRLIENHSSSILKVPMMVKMLNVMYLRSRELCGVDCDFVRWIRHMAPAIKDSTTSTSVKLMCDWLMLMAMMPCLGATYKSAQMYFNQASSKRFLNIRTRLDELQQTYPGFDKALSLEANRKEALDRREMRKRKEGGKWTSSLVVTNLPLIFQNAEAEPLLKMVDDVTGKFSCHEPSWIQQRQEFLLSVLETAGHIAQFAESSGTEVEPQAASAAFVYLLTN